jgi:hypothetical protein
MVPIDNLGDDIDHLEKLGEDMEPPWMTCERILIT